MMGSIFGESKFSSKRIPHFRTQLGTSCKKMQLLVLWLGGRSIVWSVELGIIALLATIRYPSTISYRVGLPM